MRPRSPRPPMLPPEGGSALSSTLPPPPRLLEKLRGVMFFFATLQALFFALRVLVSGQDPLPVRGWVVLAVVLVSAVRARSQSKGAFTPLEGVLEGVALSAVTVALREPEQALGVLYMGMLYRALFGSTPTVVAASAVYAVAYLVGLVEAARTAHAQDFGVLAGIATTAGVSGTLSWIVQHHDQAIARATALTDASLRFARTQDLERAWGVTLDAAMALTRECGRARVALALTEGDGARWVGSRGANAEGVTGTALALGGLPEQARSALDGGNPLELLAQDEKVSRAMGGDPSFQAMFVIPLAVRGELRGVLRVETGERLPEETREALCSLGAKAALCVDGVTLTAAVSSRDALFRVMVENVTDVIAIAEGDGTLTYLSPSAERTFGRSHGAGTGRKAWEFVHAEDQASARAALAGALEDPSTSQRIECRVGCEGGGFRPCEAVLRALPSPSGAAKVLLSVRDESDRRRTEEALRRAEERRRRSEKAEAIGQLASGVAHDFNNKLCVILSYSHLALDGMPEGDPGREDLLEIQKAAGRASELVRQLLVFSGRELVHPEVLEADGVVGDLARLLPNVLGEHITLETRLASGSAIEFDPDQLRQIVMNLALNARDAMPDGGTLTLTTERVERLPATDAGRALCPGPWVKLTVTDTGYGMTREVLEHIFEPFFTTKGLGKNPGLGLPAVVGAVEQGGGTILVQSEPGRGATFEVFLPCVGAVAKGARAPQRAHPAGGSETVLLAEDEESVRTLAKRVLEARGYTVLVARDGAEGLQLAAEHRGGIDLVVADVFMPKVNGPELIRRLREETPSLRALLVSGQPERNQASERLVGEGVPWLPKPFSPGDLEEAVRKALDDPPPAERLTPR